MRESSLKKKSITRGKIACCRLSSAFVAARPTVRLRRVKPPHASTALTASVAVKVVCSFIQNRLYAPSSVSTEMPEFSPESQVLATLVAGAVAKMVFGVITRMNRRQAMVKVGTVTQLNCYPVKSCRQISVEEGICTRLGLKIGKATDRLSYILIFIFLLLSFCLLVVILWHVVNYYK